jgi:hypothetical protein
MAKAGWASQELRRVELEVQTLPSWVKCSAVSVPAPSTDYAVSTVVKVHHQRSAHAA